MASNPPEGRNAVQRLSHVHEAVLNWLVLNPDRSMRECADAFGYTQPWLSTLVHSDIFQAALAERHAQIASRVASTIPAKLQAVANIALDKLAEKVASSEDPEFILDAADRALHRLGYAPASARNPNGSPAGQGANVTQNNIFVSAEDLAKARELMDLAGRAGTGVLPPIDAEVLPRGE